MTTVSLREITKENLRDVLRLKVAPPQKEFVADNATSIAQAHFEPLAWFRAIYADETVVGFVMMFEDPEKPTYYLWRFMIGESYQGQGYGREALKLLIERVKRLPKAKEMLLSYVPAQGGPQPFYQKLGFIDTGEMEEDEMVMKLTFDRSQ